MTCKEFSLDTLEVPNDLGFYLLFFVCFFYFLKGPQIVECLIHCVFFVRGLGLVKPVTTEVEDLELAYAKLDGKKIFVLFFSFLFLIFIEDPALDAAIKEKVKLFLDLQFAAKSTGEISVSFFEKKVITAGWFSQQQEENVCWEKWTLKFKFIPGKPQVC